MLVKFSCIQDSSYGLRGLLNAIQTIATAPAGTAPAAPAGIQTWAVIANAEAGGWSVDGANNVPDAVTGPNTANFVQISATTPKSGSTDYGRYKKVFRLNVNQSSGANANWWEPIAYASLGPNNFVSTFYSPAANGGTNGSTTGQFTAFNVSGNTAAPQRPANGYFIVASTANYFYIAYGPNGFYPGRNNVFNGQALAPIFGIGDLTSGSAADYSVSDPHFPCAAFMSTGAIEQPTSSSWQAYGDRIGYRFYTYDWQYGTKSVDPQGNAYGAYYSCWINNNAVNNNNQFALYTNPILPLGPTYLTDSSANGSQSYLYNYDMMYDSTGNLRPSLIDIVLFQPLQNYPFRRLQGVKYAGLFSFSDTYAFREQIQSAYAETILYDEDNIPWYVITHQGVPRCLRAR